MKIEPLSLERTTALPDSTHKRILRQLLYYDIFDHLQSEEELIKDCSLGEDAHKIFEWLVNKGLVFRLDNYNGVRNDTKLLEKRKRGELNTQQAMPRAIKMGKLISKFPYVRAVALSGSISKGYMDSFKDVDYFIITKPKRLWLSRIMLIFYKKIFLLNSFRFFCLNYFIDENNLEIEDENIFTATEINTLIPIYGNELMNAFFRKNKWVKEVYKHFPKTKSPLAKKPTDSFFKKMLEFLFNNFLGNWLDILSMKITVQYWKWKYNGDKKYLFKSSFRFRRDEAKYHPGNFQEQVLKKFNERIASFEENSKVKKTYEN